MVDLTTTYLGLNLKNPLVASASPLAKKLSGARRLEDAGVAAIVMESLFEEQIVQESLQMHDDLSRGADSHPEARSYLADYGFFQLGPEAYLEHLHRVKSALGIPVIGSLNGFSTGGWVEYARKIEQAGADALELNLYDLATDPGLTGVELEARHVALVQDIRKEVRIPIAVKLSPFYTALPNFARRLSAAGANGLVLFNRFYQPDFDLETLEVIPNLVLSNSHELRLPLRWIAILFGRVKADFALTSGVHTGQDLIKAMMAGASIVMSASALLKSGHGWVERTLADAAKWMEEHEYASVRQMIGSMSQQSVAEPAVFERANYIKTLRSY
jgi:dihydroorotate dehydrogenase (fumarate)